METAAKGEEQFISDIKESIEQTTLKVSDKVVKSAFTYLVKNNCLQSDKQDEVKAFVKKIPSVLAAEISKELNTVLGLNLEI